MQREDAKNGHRRGEEEEEQEKKKQQHEEEEEEKEEEEEEEQEEQEEEEEYVVLDLEEVFNGAPVPANCPYTLTGLDTMSPVLTLGNGLMLVGEYEETMGSVLIFSESEDDTTTATHEHDDETDFPTPINPDTRVKEVKKRVQSVCKLERRIKFRVMQTGTT